MKFFTFLMLLAMATNAFARVDETSFDLENFSKEVCFQDEETLENGNPLEFEGVADEKTWEEFRFLVEHTRGEERPNDFNDVTFQVAIIQGGCVIILCPLMLPGPCWPDADTDIDHELLSDLNN